MREDSHRNLRLGFNNYKIQMKPTFCNNTCYSGNSRVSRALGYCEFRSISLNINSIEVMALIILILIIVL